MRITSIHYERLANLGNYENVKLGCDVIVSEGESTDDALALAETFVDEQVVAIRNSLRPPVKDSPVPDWAELDFDKGV